MIKRETKAGKTHLTFVLPQDGPAGPVSVVAESLKKKPGVHTLRRRSNGTRSVRVPVQAGSTYRFRYLGDNGHWFDDPHHEVRDDENGVVLT